MSEIEVAMTEMELRLAMARTMTGWVGLKESDGTNRVIIDTYNAHLPRARGYALSYADPWCAGTVSAAAIVNALTDIIPTECSCTAQIALFRALGRWVEQDDYIPAVGDVMYYDWQDTGAGDCVGAPDHVGLVTSVDGTTITVVEGNKSSAVGYRRMAVGGRYIRGYGIPDYAGKAAKEAVSADTTASWWQASWEKGKAKGVVDGTRPADALTRREFVSVLDRMGLLD